MSDTVSLHRWIAKKGARAVLGAASAPFCNLKPLFAGPPQIRVLTYHCFGDVLRAPFSVSRGEFERHIKWLKQRDLVIAPAEFRDVLETGRGIGGDKILITIDDGHESVSSIALPVLRDHDVPAIMFAVAGWTGREGYLDKRQLLELADSNIEIGSHSMTHCSIAKADAGAAQRELRDSRSILEDITGRAVTSFAYPYGTLNDFNAATRAQAHEAGYRLVFTSQHGTAASGTDPLEIPRIKVEGGDPGWHFPVLCKGGMDAWRMVDTVVPFLQKPLR